MGPVRQNPIQNVKLWKSLSYKARVILIHDSVTNRRKSYGGYHYFQLWSLSHRTVRLFTFVRCFMRKLAIISKRDNLGDSR